MANKKNTSSTKPSTTKSSTAKKAITITKKEKPKNINKTQKIELSSDVRKPKKKKNKIHKIINAILSLTMFLGICIMLLVMGFCVYIVISAPPFEADKLYSQEASIFLDKNEEEFARVGTEKRETKTYGELPQTFVDALVATEDSRFFQHNGFDVIRFVKASLGQLAGNSGAGGASTLTMQVAKNTFSKSEDGTIASTGMKGIIRKFTDIYMAIFLIEKNYTKEEIIEFYANSQELGQNSFGVEQASQTYFGKSISDLSLTESALLVGLFNGPSIYNPYAHPENADARRATVLDLMVRHGYITEEQAEDAKAIPVESLLTDLVAEGLNEYQQFLDVAIEEVIDKTGLNPYTTSMIVYTTLDRDLQTTMNKLNSGKLGYKWKTYKYNNNYQDVVQFGGVVTDVHDGSIAAVNGGRHQERPRAYSRATMMKTQPGSTAKPIFAYGPYLEYNNGSPSTIFYDNRMTFSNGQSLKNADGTYKGAMTMRQALAQSRNIPAVQAFQAVDKNKISEFVHNLGVDYCKYDDGVATDCNLYESYAIGGGLELSPVDMAGAYGTFARGGYYIEPYTITKIIYRETDEVKEYKYEKTQAMSEETAYMITDILMTATKQGVGGNINVKGTDVASKTGTSTTDSATLRRFNIPDSQSKDNWIITYSPDYVISCWYGVDKLDYGVYVDAIAASVERKKIMAILANNIYKTNSKFEEPSGIVSAQYELETHPFQKPSEYTPGNLISTDVFKKGTEPSEVSSRFSQLNNPSNGNASVNGNVVTLTWNPISTPNAINTSYLQQYFTENYGQFASSYLNKRLNYNESNIGTLGYQVYLSTDAGVQDLGFTNTPSFSYTATHDGNYNFIVKSSYSIFKSNMSSGYGISINVNAGLGSGVPSTPTDPTTPENNENTNDNQNQNQKPNNQNSPSPGGFHIRN